MGAERRDDGQAAIALVTIVSVLFVALVAATTQLGVRTVDRARAQTAADAVALASVDDGPVVAAAFARLHGAELVAWHRGPAPAQVTVVVSVGDVTATARATNTP